MADRRDDPTFLYFPDNYRWSMGLLICLSAAPWTGVEIDEVNRVGRALRDRVGDDAAWFAEWTRMGDKVFARGQEEGQKGHSLTTAACFMRAVRYYQTGERFLQPKSPTGLEVYKRSVSAMSGRLRKRTLSPLPGPSTMRHPMPRAARSGTP